MLLIPLTEIGNLPPETRINDLSVECYTICCGSLEGVLTVSDYIASKYTTRVWISKTN